ncbi:hypothetical protein [Corynebacterium tapiri]|nr:hypothetical protein [Corynebacterium tapiri]
MGQEYVGGPEVYQEFDPEAFVRELKKEAARAQADDAQQEGQGENS